MCWTLETFLFKGLGDGEGIKISFMVADLICYL